MSTPARKREVGRGERVLPGLWRLRLPLPWPGVPHCNAWAIAAGDGIVRVEHVRLLVCTHAHSDHYGQAGPVTDRAGCELWMHPDHAHMTAGQEDPEASLARRMEIARSAGVPQEPLERYMEARRGMPSGIARLVEPDRDLVDGVRFESDLGAWEVVETPGHAPSHVCLWQPERRLLISGDHLLGRVSLYYDF